MFPRSTRLESTVPVILAIALVASMALVQVRIGGTRPAFAIPGYLGIAGTAVLSLLPFGRKTTWPDRWCLVSTCLFFSYALLRVCWSPLPFLARTNLFLILAALTVYFLTAIQITSGPQRLFVLAGLLLLELGHVWIGVVQFIRGDGFLPFGYQRPDDYGNRASGFYVCPDHLAGLLECLILLGLALCLFGRIRLWLRVVLFYFSGMGLAMMLITGSRGAYISMAVAFFGLFLFGLYHTFRVARRRFGLVMLVGGVIILAGTWSVVGLVKHNEFVQGRFQNIANSDKRPLLWKAAIKQFELNPAFGTGSGTYLIYGRKFADPSLQTDPVYAHNDYLQLLAEFGIAGIALLAAFLGAHFWNGARFVGRMEKFLRKRNLPSSLSLGFVAGSALAVVALLVHSTVDFNLQIPGNTLVVAFLFGILANPGAQWESRVAQRSEKTKLARSAEGQVEESEQMRGAKAVLTRGTWSEWVLNLLPLLPALGLFVWAAPTLPAEIEAEAARTALEHGTYALAIYHAKKAVALDNQNPDSFYYLGEARRQLGSRFTGPGQKSLLGAADEAFDQAVHLFPMDNRILVKAGVNAAQLGEFQKSNALFTTALDWSPELGIIYAYLGVSLELQGRIPEAIAAYKHSNELSVNKIAVDGLQETLDRSKPSRPSSSPNP